MRRSRKILLFGIIMLFCVGILDTMSACGSCSCASSSCAKGKKHVHIYDDGVTTAATCTTKGEKIRTCTLADCNNDGMRIVRESIEIDENAHSYEWVDTTPMTETNDGIQTYQCKYNVAHANGTRPIYTTGTKGLEYKLTEDNDTEYEVKKGEAIANRAIVVPRFYNGKSVTGIGQYAFMKCSDLKSITIPNTVTRIGRSAFQECKSLTDINIPNTVTSIERFAFRECRSLTNITIPDGVTSIEDGEFFDCSTLASVTLGSDVASIGKNAFYGCVELKNIYFKGTESEWNEIVKNYAKIPSVTVVTYNYRGN